MSITDQIRKQLEQPDGLTIEALTPLADAYGRETAQVNARLSECTQLLRKGLRSEAIQRAFMKPNVLDWSARLDFSEFDDWLAILQFYGITVPTLLDRDAAQEIQEAIVDEQPLEELLRQHRRLAIAKAPLSWRLKVLRRLGKIDYANVVWREDQEQWETVRLKQIPAELKEAIESKSLVSVQSICAELNECKWAVAPSQDLCKRASKAANSFLHAEQSLQLKLIADQLHAAYGEGNESTAAKQYRAWTEIVNAMRSPPPADLVQSVEPAIEWLQGCTADRERIAKHEKASASLEDALQRKSTLADIQRSYYDVTSHQMGIDPILEQRYKARVNELQQATKRRLQLAITAISVSAVTLMIALGLWQWNQTYRKAVDDSSSRLTALIDAEELTEADSIVKKLILQAPQIAMAPELVSLIGKLKVKQDAETIRGERASSAIAAAHSDDPTEIDIGNLISAEKQAKTPEEKMEIQKVRRAWDRHEQGIVNNQFETIRITVKTVEERLMEIQKMQLSDASESELQSLLIDLTKLKVDFPRGANRAAKILELAMERAISLRNSVRKQRRDVEIRQQATKGMREAKTLAMFQSEMKQFADKLPGDTVATEFAEALREADLWKRVDDWNAWCKRLADSLAGGLSPTELKSLLAERTTNVNGLSEHPNTAPAVKLLEEQFAMSEQRSASLDSLLEDLNNAVIADLVTIIDGSGGPPVGKRQFMTWEARVENDAIIKKHANLTKFVLPVVSDNLGASTNSTYRGKITVINEPRASIRNITRRFETTQPSVLEDWEGGLTSAMQDVVGGQNLDSQIKEILLTRLVNAASEGSAAMRDAFKELRKQLDERTDNRAFWFNSSEMNEALDKDVILSFREGMKNLDILRRQTNETLNQLAASKLVWVGAMLRDTNGKVEAWLYRDDVPDGEIVSVIPGVQLADAARVVPVGRINGKQASLSGEAETALAGRPLYWIRPVKTNSN